MENTTKKKTPEEVLNKKVELLTKELDKALDKGNPLLVLKTAKELSLLASKYTYEASKLATKDKLHSWSEVGSSMGVSKQAAHEKFKRAQTRYNNVETKAKEKVDALLGSILKDSSDKEAK